MNPGILWVLLFTAAACVLFVILVVLLLLTLIPDPPTRAPKHRATKRKGNTP